MQINDPFAKICVPDDIKNTNVKVFNIISRANETRYIERHKTCKCKCRCRCECKELYEKGLYDKGFIWNSSNCECECDKSCDIGEYLDYKNCKCRKKIIDKLVKEFSENIFENETLDINPLDAIPLNVYKKMCNSCMVYIVLFVVFLIIYICICTVFIYFHWCLKKITYALILVLDNKTYK